MSANREGDRQGQGSVQDSQSVNLKRRRLVKGLAGATPGIFTLYSGGSAAALASATQRCILDQYTPTVDSVLVSDDFFADAYQRGTLKNKAIEVKNGSNYRWLVQVPEFETGLLHWYEAEVSDMGGVSWSGSPSQEWILCGEDEADKKLTFSAPGEACKNGKGDWKVTDATPKEVHSLFCVDDQGEVMGILPEDCGTEYRPVNRSCWASIDPGAPDPTDRGDWW